MQKKKTKHLHREKYMENGKRNLQTRILRVSPIFTFFKGLVTEIFRNFMNQPRSNLIKSTYFKKNFCQSQLTDPQLIKLKFV